MQRSFDPCQVFRRLPDAVAQVSGVGRHAGVRGQVMFYRVRDGVIVRAALVGLPRGNGRCDQPVFGFHIHGGMSCSGNETDPFADAGSHFDLYECPHPYHAGDLPPLFGVGGKAFAAFLTDRFMLDEVLGKTVIVHDRPDDFTTQPAGNAGNKIACGIIRPVAR